MNNPQNSNFIPPVYFSKKKLRRKRFYFSTLIFTFIMFVFIPFILLINLQTTIDSYINSEKQISEINDIMHEDKNNIESTGIESLSVDEIAAIDHLENSGMVNEYILKYINTRFGREVGKLISKVVRICRYIYHLS